MTDGVQWNDLMRAGALVLVLEGVMPFLAPTRSRLVFQRLAGLKDRSLRLFGLGSMIVGTVLLQLVHQLA